MLHGTVFDRPVSFTASLVHTLSCAKNIIARTHLLANLRPIISSGNKVNAFSICPFKNKDVMPLGYFCNKLLQKYRHGAVNFVKNFLYTKGCTGTIRSCGELMAQVGGLIVLFTTDATLAREALSTSAKILGNPEITVPRKIQYVETLPLLGTGKTDYVTLKKMALSVNETPIKTTHAEGAA